MTIVIKKKKIPFKLWLPNSFIKSKFIRKYIECDLQLSKVLYREIRKFVTVNGHFTLLDIETDGIKVLIRV